MLNILVHETTAFLVSQPGNRRPKVYKTHWLRSQTRSKRVSMSAEDARGYGEDVDESRGYVEESDPLVGMEIDLSQKDAWDDTALLSAFHASLSTHHTKGKPLAGDVRVQRNRNRRQTANQNGTKKGKVRKQAEVDETGEDGMFPGSVGLGSSSPATSTATPKQGSPPYQVNNHYDYGDSGYFNEVGPSEGWSTHTEESQSSYGYPDRHVMGHDPRYYQHPYYSSRPPPARRGPRGRGGWGPPPFARPPPRHHHHQHSPPMHHSFTPTHPERSPTQPFREVHPRYAPEWAPPPLPPQMQPPPVGTFPENSGAPPQVGPSAFPIPMPFGAPPNAVLDSDEDTLANLLMAWYYSGYYTGRYQALQEAQRAAAKDGYHLSIPNRESHSE